jgi:hypothetical protein
VRKGVEEREGKKREGGAPGPLFLSFWRVWFGTPRGGRTSIHQYQSLCANKDGVGA